MLHNYAKMVLEFSLVNTLCVFLTVTQIWEFIDVPKKMAFQTAKKHYFPVLKTVVKNRRCLFTILLCNAISIKYQKIMKKYHWLSPSL